MGVELNSETLILIKYPKIFQWVAGELASQLTITLTLSLNQSNIPDLNKLCTEKGRIHEKHTSFVRNTDILYQQIPFEHLLIKCWRSNLDSAKHLVKFTYTHTLAQDLMLLPSGHIC